MPIEAGAGVISGGAVAVFVMKMLPILMKRINGKGDNINNSKPGKAKICIEQGKKIVEHDVTIRHLCELSDKADRQAETFRTENRQEHQRIFDKLDGLVR